MLRPAIIVWAERFDQELGDLFTVRDEITERIAYTLRLKLLNIEAQRAERARTTPEAMDYVMRGRALALRPPSRDNYRQEQEMFERALQLDDRLPAAQTGLANTLSGKVLDWMSDAPEADLRRADDLISTVLAVHSDDGRAHHVKAQILRAQARFQGMQDRFKLVIAEYETAIALDHNSASSFLHLAAC